MEGPTSDSGMFRQKSPASNASSAIILLLDANGGVTLDSLPHGTILEVATRNHTYTLIPQESGETLIWGHPRYCPEPVLLAGVGASYLNGVFREGYIGNGMRLNFPHEGKRVHTSRIISINAKRRS
jgi:hypothetical protein